MAVEFLGDTKPDYKGACWSYRCTGLHEGSPITCYVYDPMLDHDEGLTSVQYRKVEWDIPADVTFRKADHPPALGDKDELEDCADDFYWYVEIRDDMREALMR